MKNFKLFLPILITALSIVTLSAANISPDNAISTIDNADLHLSLKNDADVTLFTDISYCSIKERLCFKSIYSIEFVQILDDKGQIIYQLPIEIAKLHLALSTFGQGDYTINLKLDGRQEMVSTEFTKK